jgi:hemerythrin-like domain-containing protein
MRSLIETFQAVKSRSGALQEWEIQCIQNLWKLHFLHIHTHHSDEDDILVPRLSKRFRYPEKYAADHDELVAKLNKISDMMRSFEIANTHTPSSSLERVLSELLDYEKIMLPHLKQEEDQCLPLMRAYFTPKEVNRLMQKMNAFAPKVRIMFISCFWISILITSQTVCPYRL